MARFDLSSYTGDNEICSSRVFLFVIPYRWIVRYCLHSLLGGSRKMNPEQLLEHVIRPSLEELGLGGPGAETLLLVTAAVESEMGYYLKQTNGPALGIYQMEPNTHDDLISNYVASRAVYSAALRGDGLTTSGRLLWDLKYATKAARLHYRRYPEPMPEPWDIEAMWQFYKLRWNSYEGATTKETFQGKWVRYQPDMVGRGYA